MSTNGKISRLLIIMLITVPFSRGAFYPNIRIKNVLSLFKNALNKLNKTENHKEDQKNLHLFEQFSFAT